MTQPKDHSQQVSRRRTVFAGVALLLVIGGAIGVVVSEYALSPEALAEQLRAVGAWAPVAVIVLMILHSFVPFPAEILAICAGAVFGTLMGSLLIWMGAMLGALAAFGLSRRLGQQVVHGWLTPSQASRMSDWTQDRGVLALLISRFIPVIAFNLINYAAGLTKVPLWTFIWTTGLGILPFTVLMAYLGAQMKELSWTMLLTVSGVGVILVCGLHQLAKARRWI
ncbi:TVP38/TMEM64 family protein [Parasedimentitalea marina]|uniref:TVP38/TMEM64 family membrane protein n=1 Tax=Parasedimentitalea marina TaxID=2483033 RepID=A0A3T0N6U8_9RHOB|nr:TVP38/TMEM64 family protein [Parasedimentitalea marina]AZV79760.1 TVP38/TMEM64 family protein [Parasedimentitalea marina]